MNEVFFPATKHSSLGNEFLVCLLTEDDAKEDVAAGTAEGTADVPPVEEAHRYFENLRLQGKWNADGLVLAWEDEAALEDAREAATFAASPKDPIIVGGNPAGPYLAVHMRLFNSDGSEAETSGNGLCCLGQVLANRYPNITHFLVETAGRWEDVRVQSDTSEDGLSVQISTTMGIPLLGFAGSEQQRKATEAGASFRNNEALFVSVGNPHVVVMMDDIGSVNPSEDGPRFIADFGEEVNVEFVSYNSESEELDMKVWERGVGETQACGSGAVASVVALSHWKGGKIKAEQKDATPQIYEDVKVNMAGGSALVRRYYRSFLPMLYIAEVKYLGEYDPA